MDSGWFQWAAGHDILLDSEALFTYLYLGPKYGSLRSTGPFRQGLPYGPGLFAKASLRYGMEAS